MALRMSANGDYRLEKFLDLPLQGTIYVDYRNFYNRWLHGRGLVSPTEALVLVMPTTRFGIETVKLMVTITKSH